MPYNSPIPTNPNDPEYYPFMQFVSNVGNISRNLDSMGLTAADLELPIPEIFSREKSLGFEELWPYYRKSSSPKEAISEHSWNTQYLKDYCLAFNLRDNPDKLIGIYKSHLGHFRSSSRDEFGRFLQSVDNSNKLNQHINSDDKKSGSVQQADSITTSPQKDLFDAYFSILVAHIQSAELSTVPEFDKGESKAKWDGSDEMSKDLLSRLQGFQGAYSPKAERLIGILATFISKYPKASALLSGEKQRNLREQLIKWQLQKIEFDLEDKNFIVNYKQLLPETINSSFFDEYFNIDKQIKSVNEQVQMLMDNYGLTKEEINKELTNAWQEYKSIGVLVNTLSALEEVEKVKEFLKEKVSEDQSTHLSAITPASICSKEDQFEWFKRSYEKWCNEQKDSLGQVNYNLCLQALNKIENTFEPAERPIQVIHAIESKLEKAKEFALKQIEQCKVMEYHEDTFTGVKELQALWASDSSLSDIEKEHLQAVVEKIKELKKQHFYQDDKPKLVQDINHKEDVLGFYQACHDFINKKADEIGLSLSAKEQFYNVLKGIFNFVIMVLSAGRCTNFFATQSKETLQVKETINELHQKLSEKIVAESAEKDSSTDVAP